MDNRNDIYVNMPTVNKPKIPNMGALFKNYCKNSLDELSIIKDELSCMSKKVSNLEDENKSLKAELAKLQKESWLSVAGFIVALLGVLSQVIALLF